MVVVSVLGALLILPILFCVPGWLILRRLGMDPLLALYGSLAVGAGYAAAVVGIAQVLPWTVRASCVSGVILLAGISGWCWRTAPRPLLPAAADRAGFGLFLLAYLAAAAFVAVPSYPFTHWAPGTIGPGRIESPRWAGQQVDNILPYRTGQVALYREGGELRDKFSVGWWISDRTPLVGLDFAFAAGSLGVSVRRDDSTLDVRHVNGTFSHDRSVTMQLKDHWGWWFYNFLAILLASAVVLGVYLLARVWKDDRRVATAAAAFAALAPGFFLNEIYTWPKQATAYFVLVAAALAVRRQAALAGACLGIAYLVHPVALFYLPSVALVLLFLQRPAPKWQRTLLAFVTSLIVVILPWQLWVNLRLHAISKLALWPLQSETTLRTDPSRALSQAWHYFVHQGLFVDVWNRVASTGLSIFPTDLAGQLTSNRDIVPLWESVHGISLWGTLGLVVFPVALIYLAVNWRGERRMALLFAGGYLIPTILAASSAAYGDAWSHQSGYALVGLFCIWAASGLLSSTAAVRGWVVAAVAFEYLTVSYGTEYRPFNIGVGSLTPFFLIGASASLYLIYKLVAHVGLTHFAFPQARARARAASS